VEGGRNYEGAGVTVWKKGGYRKKREEKYEPVYLVGGISAPIRRGKGKGPSPRKGGRKEIFPNSTEIRLTKGGGVGLGGVRRRSIFSYRTREIF